MTRPALGRALGSFLAGARAPGASPAPADGYALLLLGKLVHFNHEPPTAPPHFVDALVPGPLVELNDLPGQFAPHLFKLADPSGD